jgi:CDP-diacylglycerol--glycerol-3-phosphate 3-phosphatidyltransferase
VKQDEGDPLALPTSSASTWNVANGLTVFRLLLVPLFVLALLQEGGHQPGWRLVAFGVFAVASYTDRVDGQLARSRNLVTSFGKLADPIADKALMGAALIGLSALDDLPWWITLLVLSRELGVTVLRFWVIRHGVIPASRGGKLKTLLQGLAIGFYLLPLTGWAASGRAAFMAIAVVLTVVTGLDYVARALTLRQTSERAAMKRARRAERAAQRR